MVPGQFGRIGNAAQPNLAAHPRGWLKITGDGPFAFDQEFTLEAGTKIWGYPKVMADFTIRDGRQFGFDLTINGQFVIGMEFSLGLPIPLTPRTQAQRSYSHRDGVTRETAFEMTATGVRNRPRGVRMRLGDHPYAKELASLGIPKSALLSSSVDNVQMSFDDAKEVSQ